MFFAIARLSENDDWVIVLGLAGQYVGNLGVLWLLSRFKDDASLGFEIEPRDTLYIGLGLLLQLGLALLLLPLAEFLFPDGQPPQEIADVIGSPDSSTVLKVSLVLAAVVLAPVTEEIIFRGVLLKALRNYSNRFIIVVTAAVFGRGPHSWPRPGAFLGVDGPGIAADLPTRTPSRLDHPPHRTSRPRHLPSFRLEPAGRAGPPHPL